MKVVISTQRLFYVSDEVCKTLILNNSPCIVRRNAESAYKGKQHPDLEGAKQWATDLGDGVSKIRKNYFFHGEDLCYFSYSKEARCDEEFISLLTDEDKQHLKVVEIPDDLEDWRIVEKDMTGEVICEIKRTRSWQ